MLDVVPEVVCSDVLAITFIMHSVSCLLLILLTGRVPIQDVAHECFFSTSSI